MGDGFSRIILLVVTKLSLIQSLRDVRLYKNRLVVFDDDDELIVPETRQINKTDQKLYYSA